MHHFRRKRITGRIWRRIKQFFGIIRNIMLVFLFIMLLIVLITTGWFYREFSRAPKVKDNTILVMNMKGLILDGPSFSAASQRILGEDVQTLRGMINNLRKATEDPRINGILLNMKGFGMTFATGQEIREELFKFKESGKKIFVYMEWASTWGYFLTSLADKIYMPPSGSVYLASFSTEIPFYRKLLDKIGIQPEHMYIGKYKTGPQPEMLEGMSEEHREVANDILDAYYTSYVEQLAIARHVSQNTVKEWINGGFYTAVEAHEVGIVDELMYEEQLEKELKIELGLLEEPKGAEEETEEGETSAEEREEEEEEEGPELPTLNNAQYARVKVKVPGLHKKGEKIAVVYASGVIVPGRSSPIGSSSPFIGSESMTQLLKSLAEDKKIKGIILRVDSPGGGARASDLIRYAVNEAKK